jgi:hypothetical protein
LTKVKITQTLPTLVLKLKESAQLFKKDNDEFTTEQVKVKQLISKLRKQFLGYV